MQKANITVLIITYNQQNTISRAIDSIICQKNWGLNEIIISDDCSTDDTWSIVSKYVSKYPTIIKAYRNNRNLGIYANLETLFLQRGNADLYSMLSGDDAFCDGWLEEIQVFINRQKIALNEAFVIYSDWKNISPNNKEYIIKNNYISKGYNPFSLKTRHLISNRSTLISRKTALKYQQIELNKGLAIAEEMFDYQMSLHSEKNYYCSYVGTIYFSGIGISTKLNTKEYRYNIKDIYYLNFYISTLSYFNYPNLLNLYSSYKFYILSFVWGYWPQIKSDLVKLLSMINTYIQSLKK